MSPMIEMVDSNGLENPILAPAIQAPIYKGIQIALVKNIIFDSLRRNLRPNQDCSSDFDLLWPKRRQRRCGEYWRCLPGSFFLSYFGSSADLWGSFVLFLFSSESLLIVPVYPGRERLYGSSSQRKDHSIRLAWYFCIELRLHKRSGLRYQSITMHLLFANFLFFCVHWRQSLGGTSSLRMDRQGKCYAQMLLDFPIEIPASLVSRL